VAQLFGGDAAQHEVVKAEVALFHEARPESAAPVVWNSGSVQ
jgi:hypothetical protein